VPHETLGEVIKAYLVIKNDAALAQKDIQGHIANRLEAYKIPETIEFLDHLPKNSAGKVLKPRLRETNNHVA
jgi:long-chain acyl-CoA synthetase